MKVRSMSGLVPLTRVVCLLAAGTVTFSPLAAVAAESDASRRPYVEIFGGLSTLGDQNFDFTPTTGVKANGRLDAGRGWLGGAALGYQANENIRVEAEIIYSRNQVKGATATGLAATNDGDYASLAIMGSALLDVASYETDFAVFKPFVGVGLGFIQEVDADLKGGVSSEFDQGGKLAYQIRGGVRWRYESGVIAGIGLRYLKADNLLLKGPRGRVDAGYDPLSFNASIGWSF
jgi:opacity protein-like surface antigen